MYNIEFLLISIFLLSSAQQKKLQDYCYFYETLVNGWFQFRSAVNETHKLGFGKNGNPINRPLQQRDNQCTDFQKQRILKNSPTDGKNATKSHSQPQNQSPQSSIAVHSLRHKHHREMINHQLKQRLHKEQLLKEEALKYAQSHVPQPHSHHVTNVTGDSAAAERLGQTVRPAVRKRLHKTKKHRIAATRRGKTKQRPISVQPELMVNDDPSLRPEDLPNMLDYNPHQEYSKFRARPAYFDKSHPASLHSVDTHQKPHHFHLVHDHHIKLDPLVQETTTGSHLSASATVVATSVNKHQSKVHHHHSLASAKDPLLKFRNSSKRQPSKMSFDNVSNSHLNSNS